MLSERELRHVEELIDRLVEAIPKKQGKEGKIQIKKIVFEGSTLSQRKRWATRKYRRFVAWCAREYKIVTPSSGPADDPIISFSDRVPVSDTAAIARASGNYLMFTLIGSRKVRVTWLELKRTEPGAQAPRFEAYRDDDLVFHGVYYAAQGTVFLYRHTPGSSYSRSIYLTRSGVERRGDMFGIVSGASNDKMIFASATYAYALDDETTMAECSAHIGEQSRKFVRDEYPEAEKSLRKHVGVQMDVTRAPDSR
ncbi:hypothetical protein ACVWZR_002373 [Bradyrhizobium sp. i1.3.1]